MDKYSTNLTIIDKSIDGVLGSRTRDGRMEGAAKSTELWQHPLKFLFMMQLHHMEAPEHDVLNNFVGP